MKIGLDIMGGDFGSTATVAGAILAQKVLPSDVRLVLIGDEEQIKSQIATFNGNETDFDIVHASEEITSGDHPTKSFSQKPNSGIVLGFSMLKEKKIDAFASNGNTGAMLVGAMFSAKPLPGIIRPCITTILPKENGGMGVILDVGINSNCKPEMLAQFGTLGSIFAQHVYGIDSPKVGLLNIGEEPGKGNLTTQAAYELMKENASFNFVGNLEGGDIFKETSDVVVCDGFTGNIVLKLAQSIYQTMKKRGLSDEYFERYNYENYGGTPILGISSTVMIGHGKSNATAVKNMLLLTKDVVEAELPNKIKNALE